MGAGIRIWVSETWRITRCKWNELEKKNLQDGLFEGSLGGMLGSDARDERENRRVRSQCRILVHAVLTVDAPGFQFPCAVGAPVLPFLSGT